MAFSYGSWEAYPWKNELAVQSERVVMHFNEILTENFEGKHSPSEMLDRALALTGFSVRRLIERKLVTDKLAAEKLLVRSFAAKALGEFRPQFHDRMGSNVSFNYECGKPNTVCFGYKSLADEIIHSTQIVIVHDEPNLEDGLLISSDLNSKKRLLHLSIVDFNSFVNRILNDNIRAKSDSWDPETGQVHSTRE